MRPPRTAARALLAAARSLLRARCPLPLAAPLRARR